MKLPLKLKGFNLFFEGLNLYGLVADVTRPKVVFKTISTHSRAKAAGQRRFAAAFKSDYFNSQPREGGWCRR